VPAVTRVLIVDDDEAIRETLRFALEDAGFSVDEASDGLAALRAMRGVRTPLVVLLDLMMPGLDGAGVLGSVAADQSLARRVAVVLITASSKTLPLAFANLLTELSVPVINKPFDVDKLIAAVTHAARRLAS
jgi:CheY-like chemotaxis protein